MRILHFSKYDRKGGAALAAFSSVCAQREAGADALLFAGSRESEEPFVIGPHGLARARSVANFVVERLPFRLAGRSRFDARSLGIAGLDTPAIAAALGADIVMLHNIDGLVRIADLPRFHCPIVWRTHDMWAMCGTEHYVEDSAPFRAGTPAAIPTRLSRNAFLRKQHFYAEVPSLTVCAPSSWLRDEMAASALLGSRRAVTVPNGIDIAAFAPLDRGEARRGLGLPEGAPLILFGSAGGTDDPRKGFDLLDEAIRAAAPALGAMGAELIAFGGGAIDPLPLPVHDLGRISDQRQLRALYCAADVAVVPSRLENLSLTVIEALACGTPVIAFSIGGMPDMIAPGTNGWLVPPFDVGALGETLASGLAASRADPDMAARCRASVGGRFDRASEAAAMLALFDELVSGRETG